MTEVEEAMAAAAFKAENVTGLVVRLKHAVLIAEQYVALAVLAELPQEERYDCPIHGLSPGPDCPRC